MHRGWQSVTLKGPSLKGVPRCCAKSQEEYDGDYTRLVDLVRCTLVFESMHAISVALDFLTREGRAVDGGGVGSASPRALAPTRLFRLQDIGPLPGFRGGTELVVCRAKDRMGIMYDAEQSGGNRDVLLNVWIRVPGAAGAAICLGEMQLHAKSLFELKHGLHLLYKGARVLGALDDSMVLYQGELNDKALERARKGIVRRLRCDYAALAGKQAAVQGLLQQENCPLLELNLAGKKDAEATEAFDLTLAELLLRSSDGQLSSTRLRALNLMRRGLSGCLPPAIGKWTEMGSLKLGSNALSGIIPSTIGNLVKLQILGLNRCGLEGQLPDELGECVSLHTLSADGNRLTGRIPPALGKCVQLRHVYLGENQLVGNVPEEMQNCSQLVVLDLTNNLLGDDVDGPLPPLWLNPTSLPKLKKLCLAGNKGDPAERPLDHDSRRADSTDGETATENGETATEIGGLQTV